MWNGPTGLKDDLSLKDLWSKGPLMGFQLLKDPDWIQRRIIGSLTPLLKVSRSWMILPMSVAPGVGQKPSPLDRTDTYGLASL